MTRFLLVPAFALLAACDGSLAIPDLREGLGGGSADMAAEVPAEAAMEAAPLTAKARLIAATEANGCAINISTIATIMQEAAVGNDELPGLVTELETDGLIETVGTDGLRLTTPTCTA